MFVRTHEFEPNHIHTETDEFNVFITEIEAHPSIEEGFQYVMDYIQKHHDEFCPGYTDRLITYLSERNDEIGLEARVRMRASFADRNDDV